MSTTAVVVIAALLAIALLGVFAMRARRRRALRERFGPEYERAVAEAGGTGRGERKLEERMKRRQALDIRELEPAQQQRYSESWRSVQAHFVDDPRGAVRDADQLVAAAMGDRGYPTTDFDQQASDLSVDHAGVMDNYREAHSISVRNDRGEATTDELRQAMVHYRALFQELLGGRRGDADTAGASGTRNDMRSQRREVT